MQSPRGARFGPRLPTGGLIAEPGAMFRRMPAMGRAAAAMAAAAVGAGATIGVAEAAPSRSEILQGAPQRAWSVRGAGNTCTRSERSCPIAPGWVAAEVPLCWAVTGLELLWCL